MNNRFPIMDPNSHTNNQVPALIPNSYPNIQFTNSVEPPKGVNQNFKKQKTMDVNQYPVVPNEFLNMGYNSYNFASSVNMGYNGCNSAFNNISNPQYLGGYTVNEYSQNAAKQADPQFVTYNKNASFFGNEYACGSGIYDPSTGNSYQQQSFNQGQYRSAVREKQIAYSTGFATSVNDVQISNASQYSLQPILQHNREDSIFMSSKYNPQLITTNSGTYMQPQVQISAPHQRPNQQTRKLPVQLDNQPKDQSFVFEIPHVSSRKPVAGESSDLNCGRKRKHGNMDLLAGGLLDMLQQSQRLTRFKDCSDKSEDVTVVKTTPLTTVSGSKFNSMIAGSYEYKTKRYESSIITTRKDKLKESTDVPFEEKIKIPHVSSGKPVPRVAGESSDLNCGKKRKHGNLDLLSGGLLDMLQQSHRLPRVKEYYDKSEDVMVGKTTPLTMVSGSRFKSMIADDPTGSYEYITKRYKSSIITTTKDKLKEPTEVPFEEKMNHENKEVVQEVICEFNTVSDDYTSLMNHENVSSVDCGMVLESERTKMQITSLDDNSSGNIKTSVSSACEMVSALENSETHITSFDLKNSGSGFGNIKTPSVPSCDIIMRSESENAETHITYCDTNSSGCGSKNMNTPSASMADLFTESQIKQHLSSFNQNNKAMWSENTSSDQIPCHLCYDAVYLAPPRRYCSSCDRKITKDVYYQSTDEENTNAGHCFCEPCFVRSSSTLSILGGGSISKGNLKKAKDEQKEEWVTCDRCHNWQHWICGLFNSETDKKKEAYYICPKCRLTDIEDGKWVPQTLLRAKDLPRTNLSDHIEQRLFTRIKQEREETAKSQGTILENVSEDLVVRVVVSVDKELEVKRQFRDIFGGKNYPENLKYRTKLILLFQRLEGVDVCIFGMYVQEYGSECDGPNNRCVYISYIDSVKYFQPERKTASGESFRTFVYHEILIGYLEHCKKRGFATCYIWSCPLLKDQDYIFYYHPETQKTPKEEKLRQWYELMLKKASNEGIVVGHNNLYDQFFVPKRETNVKITASRLPYFEGAFWSVNAEALNKKLDKSLNKRPLKAMGQDNPTKDVLVMQQLGDKVKAKKKNLMIVHLQHMCTCCREVMLSGSRWFCNQCNKIQLCSRCFDSGKLLSAKKIHKCQSGKNTQFSEDVLSNVPRDTKDKDGLLINSFFETRDDFLSKCENSEYQFITLGHAKYSSLMLLHHFTHNLVIKPVCTLCNNHALIDQCWHCDTCPNLYVCGSCYDTEGDKCHTHNLGHPSAKVTPKVTPEITKNKEEQQKQKVMTLNGALDALVHASRCRNIDCSYPDCQTIMRLLRHASRCSVRYAGGCSACKQAWWVLMKHAQICGDLNCKIRRCKEMKNHIEKNASSSKKKQNQTTTQK